MGIHVSNLEEEFFDKVSKTYKENKNATIIKNVLGLKDKSKELIASLEDKWKESYHEGKFIMVDEIIYHRNKHSSVKVLCNKKHINKILEECHDSPIAADIFLEMTIEIIKNTAWWPNWRKYTEKSL